MNAELLRIILKDFVIPETLAAIRAHRNATGGNDPSVDEVLYALQVDADRYIKAGEAWLKANEGK